MRKQGMSESMIQRLTAVARLPAVYLNREWNAVLCSILSLRSPILTIVRRVARFKRKRAAPLPPAVE